MSVGLEVSRRAPRLHALVGRHPEHPEHVRPVADEDAPVAKPCSRKIAPTASMDSRVVRPSFSARIASGGTPCLIAQARATAASVVQSPGSAARDDEVPRDVVVVQRDGVLEAASKTPPGVPSNCAAPRTMIASAGRRSSISPWASIR